jgi:hypothetical protein
MKFYVSKYAASNGIEEVEGEITEGKYVQIKGWSNLMRLDTEAHVSRADAVIAANVARTKKIASLKKQIEKLEKAVFQ